MRRPNLEWSHHSAVSSLIPDHTEAALEILTVAETNDWSVTEVKAAVREYKDGLCPAGASRDRCHRSGSGSPGS